MLLSGHPRLLAAGALLAATAIQATFFASDASLAATFATASPPAPLATDDTMLVASDEIDTSAAAPEVAATETSADEMAEAEPAADADVVDAELECMVKAVVHEAGNQSRAGQLAVAQLIVNRADSGRFASTICGVVNQPGQFFQTSRYNPRRDTATWSTAVAVSREARARQTADVAPGAMFFRAAYSVPKGFFRNRTHVATLGGNVFYR